MSNHSSTTKRKTFAVRVLRKDSPESESYWERHDVEYEPDMNIISVLQKIASKGESSSGKKIAPVAWDCNCLEEVCGACTMVVNGKTRQACSSLIDRLLEESPSEIVLSPMSKFPVVRDLVVDRKRIFHNLKKVKAWVPVDTYSDMGPGPKQSRQQQEEAYPLSECMSCGCCLEACPQYLKIEVTRKNGETDEAFEQRQKEAYDKGFIGANTISQVVLFNNNPTGQMNAKERTDAIMQEGGIQICGNAQNCVAVCPKEIPLTTSIAKAGRAATIRGLQRIFDK
ncbi:MAG: succinate dehydrogenase iron-sulfur subunit [Pirellulaceae bacterium]|nr:succinate dehydrogenase iron-sulfur subunit [Pirellulaceae bacterium]